MGDKDYFNPLVNSPILVIYTCALCTMSRRLMDNYESLVKNITQEVPNIKIININSKQIHGKFDENIYPSYIRRYSNKFPNLLLIPSPLWDIANKNIGCNSLIKISKGVDVYRDKYNNIYHENIISWLSNAIKSSSFLQLNSMNEEDFMLTFSDDIIMERNLQETFCNKKEPEMQIVRYNIWDFVSAIVKYCITNTKRVYNYILNLFNPNKREVTSKRKIITIFDLE